MMMMMMLMKIPRTPVMDDLLINCFSMIA